MTWAHRKVKKHILQIWMALGDTMKTKKSTSWGQLILRASRIDFYSCNPTFRHLASVQKTIQMKTLDWCWVNELSWRITTLPILYKIKRIIKENSRDRLSPTTTMSNLPVPSHSTHQSTSKESGLTLFCSKQLNSRNFRLISPISKLRQRINSFTTQLILKECNSWTTLAKRAFLFKSTSRCNLGQESRYFKARRGDKFHIWLPIVRKIPTCRAQLECRCDTSRIRQVALLLRTKISIPRQEASPTSKTQGSQLSLDWQLSKMKTHK